MGLWIDSIIFLLYNVEKFKGIITNMDEYLAIVIIKNYFISVFIYLMVFKILNINVKLKKFIRNISSLGSDNYDLYSSKAIY